MFQTDAQSIPQPAPAGPGAQLLEHLRVAVIATILLAIIVCGVYPVIVWGLAQAMFPHRANGSLIGRDGAPTNDARQAIGSSLLGQSFADARYFHPRPSAAGAGYDPTASLGSNLGPMSDKLLNGLVQKDDKGVRTLAFDGIRLRCLHYALENGIKFDSTLPLDRFKDAHGSLDDVALVDAFHAETPLMLSHFASPIPADAVTASASGLDPHISLANAGLQVSRVAAARHLPEADVRELIATFTEGPDLGILGDAGVNVLRLNIALDRKDRGTSPAVTASR